MPMMDGIEALYIIRDMGYTHPIVALTANAVVGQADMFLANGFDDFISKPIDTRELLVVLVRFIRDKQPHDLIEATIREKRERETRDSARSVQEISITPENARYFVSDAEKAMEIIEKTYEGLSVSDDEAIDSYITAVHGIKNVLANIGKAELSALALRLEQAGNDKDFTIITSETPAFIDALGLLIDRFKPADNGDDVEISEDDMVYLRDKLYGIKTACETFDIIAAKDALAYLLQKTWSRNIKEILDRISLELLHSEFEKIATIVESTEKTFHVNKP